MSFYKAKLSVLPIYILGGLIILSILRGGEDTISWIGTPYNVSIMGERLGITNGNLEPGIVTRKKLNSITDQSFYPVSNTSDHTTRQINRPAILLEPKGGFGNQLFQYACHYALARKHDLPLYIRLPTGIPTKIQNKMARSRFPLMHHPFSLDALNVPLFPWNSIDAMDQITYITDSDLLSGSYLSFLNNNSVLSLTGRDFCQSETYFAQYRDELKEMFEFKRDLQWSKEVISWENIIRDKGTGDTVAIHMRRGDFVRLKATTPESYYASAISSLLLKLRNNSQKSENITFFIFSDGMNYVREKLLPKILPVLENHQVHMVSNPYRLSGLDEFYLLTKCKHFIIPNSSFAWWAAYLGKFEEKIVYAAKFRKGYVKWLYRGDNVERQEFYLWQYGNIYYPSGWNAIDPKWENEE